MANDTRNVSYITLYIITLTLTRKQRIRQFALFGDVHEEAHIIGVAHRQIERPAQLHFNMSYHAEVELQRTDLATPVETGQVNELRAWKKRISNWTWRW